jgi:uncharacterized protein
MAEKNKEIVRQVDAAFGENNLEGFLEHCAEGIKWTMVGEKVVEGKDGIRQFMSEMQGMEPPKITNENIIAEGDSVAANGKMTMKDKNGKTVAYIYCDIYRFQGDKIVGLNSYVIKNEAK